MSKDFIEFMALRMLWAPHGAYTIVIAESQDPKEISSLKKTDMANNERNFSGGKGNDTISVQSHALMHIQI